MKECERDNGQEVCPHCGAPLRSRMDYRTHLTLRKCHNHVDRPEPRDLFDDRPARDDRPRRRGSERG